MEREKFVRMKKKSRLLSFVVAAVFAAVCMVQPVWAEDSGGYTGLIDTADLFYDDFSNGLDPDTWLISKSQWGGKNVNGGVVPENVSYTNEGVLVLTGNGDYYNGSVQGLNSDGSRKDNGRRTGAVIATKKTFGAGSYEVRMKVLPRYGACSALWTFYYNNGLNHEIDMEFPGQLSFSNVLNTNWLTTKNSSSKAVAMRKAANDGEWHVYRFDWHTNPKRVDYYVDGELILSSSEKVPFYDGRFWLGVWFPDEWCGNPNFETSSMLVDYVKITPFHETGGQRVTMTDGSGWATREEYPTEPSYGISRNFLTNRQLEDRMQGWTAVGDATVTTGNANNGQYAIQVGPGVGELRQTINPARAYALHTLTGYGKVGARWERGYLGVVCLDAGGKPVPNSRYEVEFSSTDYKPVLLNFMIMPNTTSLQVYVRKDDGTDHVYMDDLMLCFSNEE